VNYTAAMFWLNLCLCVVNQVGLLYVWWSNREKVTAKRFQLLERRLDLLEADIKVRQPCGNHDRMEANDVKLFENLDRLHGDIRELCGNVKGISKQLVLVNEHLLNGGK
jgi:hypothetical protein